MRCTFPTIVCKSLEIFHDNPCISKNTLLRTVLHYLFGISRLLFKSYSFNVWNHSQTFSSLSTLINSTRNCTHSWEYFLFVPAFPRYLQHFLVLLNFDRNLCSWISDLSLCTELMSWQRFGFFLPHIFTTTVHNKIDIWIKHIIVCSICWQNENCSYKFFGANYVGVPWRQPMAVTQFDSKKQMHCLPWESNYSCWQHFTVAYFCMHCFVYSYIRSSFHHNQSSNSLTASHAYSEKKKIVRRRTNE